MTIVGSFVIDGELTDCNTYINACRRNRYVANKIKQDETGRVIMSIRRARVKKFVGRFYFEFRWYCKNTRKDKDNVAFAKKFILDGLVTSGVISNDTWTMVDGWRDYFFVDRLNPRVEVIVYLCFKD